MGCLHDRHRVITPANVLDLRAWKLTLPTGSPGPAPGLPGIPREIKQPDLSTYQDENFTRVGTGVRFRASVSGINQVGSKYPRCELREMTPDGKTGAAWSPVVGRHTMTITQQINRLPTKKAEVVAGQIHDAAGFVILVWVRGNGDGTARVIARGINGTDTTLDPAYVLGSLLTVQIEAATGVITCGAFSMPWTTGGCYFKAGVYTQSNVTIPGEDPTSGGEVLIRSLAVTHQP
jgi:hypothetical protein